MRDEKISLSLLQYNKMDKKNYTKKPYQKGGALKYFYFLISNLISQPR